MISIIIPNYNCAARLALCLQSLHNQTYNSPFEIIIVDNGSNDASLDVIKSYDNIKLITFDTIKNPYICRNVGIEAAKGDIIGLLDAKCVPDQYWLENAAKYFKDKSAPLMIGGRYGFKYDPNDFYQLFYSLFFLDIELNYKNNYGFIVGNLFFHKKVIDTCGLFDESSLSIEDIRWTTNVINSGVQSYYAADVLVEYPAKNKSEILASNRRDARGMIDLYMHQANYRQIWLWFINCLKPPNPFTIRKIIKRKLVARNLFLEVRLYLFYLYLRWYFLFYSLARLIKSVIIR
ncbi:MAG: glycosyltransferase family 2 protein [Saprospiraceae bacterium]|nr:glycosyltransferase family 2 protein [Saprospiraceae bacterium]